MLYVTCYMDGEIFKKILKDDSEKLIIMDGGKPKFVVMNYGHYRRLTEGGSGSEKFDMDFNDLISKGERESIKEEEKLLVANENIQRMKQTNDLSLDDLPIM